MKTLMKPAPITLSKAVTDVKVIRSVSSPVKKKSNNHTIQFILNLNSRKVEVMLREKIRELVTEELDKLLKHAEFSRNTAMASGENERPVVLLNDYPSLTPREKEILEHVLHGSSYRMISRDLNLQMNTVKNHMKSIRNKMHAHNRNELRDIWYRFYPEAEDKIKKIASPI